MITWFLIGVFVTIPTAWYVFKAEAPGQITMTDALRVGFFMFLGFVFWPLCIILVTVMWWEKHDIGRIVVWRNDDAELKVELNDNQDSQDK